MSFRPTIIVALLALFLLAGCHCGPKLGHKPCRHHGPSQCAKTECLKVPCANCACEHCQCPTPCMDAKGMGAKN